MVPDQEWCGDMGPQGASCFHTLTNESRMLNKVEWDDLRFGNLCTRPETFAELKAVVEKLCHKTGNCIYQAQVKKIAAEAKKLHEMIYQ